VIPMCSCTMLGVPARLVGAVVVTAASIAALAACGGGWTDSERARFNATCLLRGASGSFCQCLQRELEDRMSFEELGEGTSRDEADALAACQRK
jgi:hypothetical protein